MNVLSLFDGSSIGYLALKESGIKVDNYFASEIDEHAIAASKRNFYDIIHLGDVTKWREWDLPKIDLIIGGSPCQGFSRQGVGLNFDDPRSKLFFEFVECVKYFKPKYFFLENVDMKKEWQDVITEYLGVEPIHVNSDLLLPQNRPRTYWANFKLEEPKQKKYSLLDYLEDIILDDYEEKGFIRVCKSFSDNSRDLVNTVNNEIRVTQSVKKGYAEANIGDGINISFPTSKSRRGRVIKGRSNCIDTSCNIGVLDNKNQVRRFTIKELERLQGYPDGLTNGMTETQAKKLIGNGWTLDVIVHFFKQLKEGME